jgi:uncharacterized protein YodC (DUF2158 family)
MAEFKQGDRVRLKTGGPIMIVKDWTQGPEGQELVACVWQAGGGEQADTFTDEELESAE